MSIAQAPKGQEPKRQRGHIRVAAIMEAGTELFREKGYDATTMTEIASRSGTAIASLYRFFPTKESLAEALLIKFAEHVLDELSALAAAARKMTPSELADAFVDFCFSLHQERRFAVGLAEAGGTSDEQRDQLRVAMLDRVSKMLRELTPSLSKTRSRTMAAVLMLIFRSIGSIGEQKPSAQGAILAEAKEMIRLYLSDAATAAN
jgi:AcrR family transcriptional regulator